jgi:acetolactate synthase-1/3 small subunit
VLDVTHRTLTIEGTGTPDKLEALLELLRDFGIVELSRTGRIALSRGDRGIRERVGRKLAAGAGERPEWTGWGV